MEHKMWYDTKDEILFLEFTRDYLETDIDWVRHKTFEMLEGKPYRQMAILISKTSKVENRTTREESNKILKDAAISDVAFVGGSAANRMIAKVMIKTGGLKLQGDFFKNTEDAVNWLKSRR